MFLPQTAQPACVLRQPQVAEQSHRTRLPDRLFEKRTHVPDINGKRLLGKQE